MRSPEAKQRRREAYRQWLAQNREKALEASRRWKEKNRERNREGTQKWREMNRDRTLEYMKNWRKSTDIGSHDLFKIKSRAWASEAVPVWLTKEHWQEIAGFYRRAQELTIKTGVLHTVDHIDPLKGENCCGLHVPWNLQVMTHAANCRKARKRDG
jgi:hypothetical protein